MSHSITLPQVLHIGEGALNQLQTVLNNMGVKNPLLITDKTMLKLGYEKKLQDGLVSQIDYFAETEPEPSTNSIEKGLLAFARGHARQGEYDGLIALGGGSVIDSAKVIAILAKNGGKVRDYKVPHIVTEPRIPLVAIPTTAGTGSEATNVCVISDAKTEEKMLCLGPSFMPQAALIDYTLTLSLPARVTADPGLDALTHAIEAYVSRKANPFSDGIALRAMNLIGKNLRRVYQDGQDKAAREAMMLGATLGGMAFSAASVALVHGMSRPIGVFFHVPHGMSNAMLLPTIVEYSLDSAKARYADCARAMGLCDAGVNDDSAAQRLLAELKALNQDLQVPTLAEFGADKERFFDLLDTMAEQAIASGSPANNPKVATHEEIVALYKKLWD